MASLAKGAGTITMAVLAPCWSRASFTDASTGMPSMSVPAFLGLVPATTLVP
jgi:hypothetical protein